jgi:adenylate cyclase
MLVCRIPSFSWLVIVLQLYAIPFPYLFRLLRSEILATTIHFENKEAIKEATTRFNNWMQKGQRVPPNLREVVYSAGKIELLIFNETHGLS